jgi:hypothetical protein
MNRAVQAANHADKDVINGWLETWTDTHTHRETHWSQWKTGVE